MPKRIIVNIGKWIVYHYCVGKKDISGEDWGDIFAKSIEGVHLSNPVGLADVVYDNMAWSAKSVKANNPHKIKRARVLYLAGARQTILMASLIHIMIYRRLVLQYLAYGMNESNQYCKG